MQACDRELYIPKGNIQKRSEDCCNAHQCSSISTAVCIDHSETDVVKQHNSLAFRQAQHPDGPLSKYSKENSHGDVLLRPGSQVPLHLFKSQLDLVMV